MIHLFKTCMITAFILGLTWSAPLRAQDQRYISIRNTDTIWLPGNICAYQFRLDNGGNDEGFGPLTITLQLKDKYGQTLVTRKMETALSQRVAEAFYLSGENRYAGLHRVCPG